MKTIFWDVDDVLNNLTREWFENYLLNINPNCKISFSQILKNPPHEIIGVSLDEYLKSLDEFRIKFGSDLKPNDELIEWFEKNGNNFRHAVLTATPMFYAPDVSKWVLKHFGNWIRSFHFIPSKRPTDTFFCFDKNKADFIVNTGACDIFIDDSEKNINDVKYFGKEALLFPQKWNNRASMNIKDFLLQIK